MGIHWQWSITSVVIGVNALLLPAVHAKPSTPTQLCDLSGAIAEVLARPEQQQGQWGIAIQDPQSDRLLFGYNAERFFVPASNQKLLTTAAALLGLGHRYQFETPIYLRGDGAHREQLVIRGVGDPTLDVEKLSDTLAALPESVTHIEEVVLDRSFFAPPELHPSWEWSDLRYYYGVPVTSFMLNENAVIMTALPGQVGEPAQVDWSDPLAAQQWQLDNQMVTTDPDSPYTGSLDQIYSTNQLTLSGGLAENAGPDVWGMAIPQPERYALDHITAILAANDITVGHTSVSDTPVVIDLEPVAAIASPPLAEILRKTNQDSNNLFAESLLKTLNAEALDPAAVLSTIGVEPEGYRLRDGSGLSRHNLITPMALVQLLDGMYDHPQGQIYRDSLAIAGRSGTLRRRFQETPVDNAFFAKTGTMTYVSALSGYLDLPDGDTLLVSILVNQSGQSARVSRQGIDDIVVAISDWAQCPGSRF